LAALGDPRPGVGLDANGLPDIDWIEVPEGDFLFGEKKEREFSWGDGFRSGWANLDEKGLKTLVGLGFLAKARPYLKQTTAVGVDPMGASPCGAQDMVGNVWDWCLNEYLRPENTATEGKEDRVLRGGSWLTSQDDARSAYRFRYGPRYRDYFLGFRVLCSSPISR
jgi:formylglycine-generating enzyme required for sulfatase activity